MRMLIAIALAGCKIWSGSYTAPSGGDDDGGTAHGSVDADTTGTEITIELFVDMVQMFGPTANGQFVAVQSGDGPWHAVEGTGGIYHARIHDDRYGVAIGCRYIQGGSSVEVVHKTLDEGVVVQRPTCAAGDLALTLDGSVSNVADGVFAEVIARANSSSAGSTFPYHMTMVRGPTDIFVSIPDSQFHASKLLRKTTFDLESSTTVSFNAADAIAYESAPLTVLPNNTNTGVQVSLQNFSGTYSVDAFGIQTPTSYNVVPAALRQLGELMAVEVSGGTSGGSTTVMTATGVPLTIQLPPILDVDLPILELDDPFPRPQVFFPTNPTTLPIVSYELRTTTFEADTGGDQRLWNISISEGWRAASHQGSYTYPDLAGVDGFLPTLALAKHHQIGMFFTRRETDFAQPTNGQRIIKSYYFTSVGEWCGDGIVQAGEQCEPPNSTGCSATCQSL